MRLPISFKLFIMTFFVLLAAMLPTAYRNYSQVKKESIDREWQFISTQSESKSQEVEWILKNLIENSIQSSTYFLEKKFKGLALNDLLNPFIKNEYMLNFEIFEIENSFAKLIHRETKTQLMQNFNLSIEQIESLRKLQNSNLSEIIKGQFLIKKINISSSKDKSVFTLILPVSKNNQNQIFRFAAVDISTEIFSKAFKNFGASLGYLIDSYGQVLAQSDVNAEFKTELSPLAQNALTKEKNKQQFQQQFTDANSNAEFIGAFVRLSMGPVLIFQSALNEVLAPAEQVRNEFIKNLVYVLSLSFLVISLFSMTLTRPIEKLVKLIPLVSKGDFEIHAAEKVNSKDEVGDLAIAFDQMTLGLKERDKVKTLFQKFHGTHVANDIISSEITLGGANKEVVVFFSDIRGFTAFSESKSPEEVVEMLNEYFAVMVDIINRNAGVVDKFIGDAIMAVWGAPNQSERDAHNAVSACLQMRLALNELNEKRLALNKSPIQIGMGLHAGHAISGTIGSNERMEYTVIGNTVNTASRVEASTKAFGTDLLITQEVAQLIQDEFLLEEAGSAEVKGRSEALKFFKVKGYLSHETNEWVEVQTPYSEYEKEASEKVKVA